MKKVLAVIADILISAFFVFSLLLALSAYWMLKTWPNLKMNEVAFQLQTGFSGTGNDMIFNYVWNCALPAFIVMIMLIVLHIVMKKSSKLSLRINLILISVLSLVISAASVYTRIRVKEYVVSQSVQSEFIRDNYVDPSSVNLAFPEKKRNLIYIFLESMEVTFADTANGGGFSYNTIPELVSLAKENEDFSGNEDILDGGYSLPNTTWTMGAMFAQTTGLPLQISIHGNDMSGQSKFFPGITTMGDILEDNGYKNMLLIGSEADFGGRELYFRTHGSYDIRDYNYANNHGLIPKDYYVWWGFEDYRLFDMAKQNLNELSSSDQPFNLTILTVDTHFEDGWVCKDCPSQYSDSYSNVMACSSKKIYEFIRWCQTQEWYENTTIVLSGDHPTMDVDYCENIPSGYDRRVYTTYINSAVENADKETYRIYSTLDNFPTTLAAMGVYIEGDRLGLGTNLFSGKKTLTERLGVSEESELLWKKSRFMEEMSGITVNVKDLIKKGSSLIKSNIRVTGYDSEEGILSLNVDDILVENGTIHDVLIITRDDQGTLYKKAEVQKDGSYSADLNISEDKLSSTSLKIVVSSNMNGKIHGETVFEYSGDNLLFLGSIQQNNAAGYIKTLSVLDESRYSIFFATQGNAYIGITDEIKEALYDFGCTLDLQNLPGISYFLVKDAGTFWEQSAYYYLRKVGYLANWKSFVIVSSAVETGNYTSTLINDGYGYKEYSQNSPGLNFVVWDNVLNKVVNVAAFNTGYSAPSASVRLTQINKETGNLTIRVKDIQKTAEPANVIAMIYDSRNPGHKLTYQLEKSENFGWAANLDISDIDVHDAYIKLFVINTEGEVFHVMNIEGDLYTYQAEHPSNEIVSIE